jgi:hypothetical protein
VRSNSFLVSHLRSNNGGYVVCIVANIYSMLYVDVHCIGERGQQEFVGCLPGMIFSLHWRERTTGAREQDLLDVCPGNLFHLIFKKNVCVDLKMCPSEVTFEW